MAKFTIEDSNAMSLDGFLGEITSKFAGKVYIAGKKALRVISDNGDTVTFGIYASMDAEEPETTRTVDRVTASELVGKLESRAVEFEEGRTADLNIKAFAPNTVIALTSEKDFDSVGDGFLIHRPTNDLWMVAGDQKIVKIASSVDRKKVNELLEKFEYDEVYSEHLEHQFFADTQYPDYASIQAKDNFADDEPAPDTFPRDFWFFMPNRVYYNRPETIIHKKQTGTNSDNIKTQMGGTVEGQDPQEVDNSAYINENEEDLVIMNDLENDMNLRGVSTDSELRSMLRDLSKFASRTASTKGIPVVTDLDRKFWFGVFDKIPVSRVASAVKWIKREGTLLGYTRATPYLSRCADMAEVKGLRAIYPTAKCSTCVLRTKLSGLNSCSMHKVPLDDHNPVALTPEEVSAISVASEKIDSIYNEWKKRRADVTVMPVPETLDSGDFEATDEELSVAVDDHDLDDIREHNETQSKIEVIRNSILSGERSLFDVRRYLTKFWDKGNALYEKLLGALGVKQVVEVPCRQGSIPVGSYPDHCVNCKFLAADKRSCKVWGPASVPVQTFATEDSIIEDEPTSLDISKF